MNGILGYQGAPYAPDYSPLDGGQSRLAAPASMSIGAPSILGDVQPDLDALNLGGAFLRSPRAFARAEPLQARPLAQVLGELTATPPSALVMPPSAPVVASTAAPSPVVAPTAAATPAAPPRGAQAPRATGPARLSEMAQIQTNLAKSQEQAASTAFDNERQRVEAAGTTTEAAQQAEQVTSALKIQAADDRATEVREREEDATIEREQRRQAAKETGDKLATAQGELENAKLDIDAAYGGAAGRIFSGLAVALGSFGASMTGGPNYALQIVNDRINREIDAQKSEIDKKKGKVTELGRLLTQNETLLGDAGDARKLAQAQTYLALAAQAEAQTKGRELGPQQQAVVNKLKADAAAKFTELQLNVQERAASTLMIAAQERQRQRAGAAAEQARQRARSEKLQDEQRGQEFELEKIQVKGRVDKNTTQDGQMTARTSALATQLQTDGAVNAARIYESLAKGLGMDPMTGKQTGNAPGVGFFNTGSTTDQGAQNRQQLQTLVEAIAKASGGVVTESDRDVAAKMLTGTGTENAARLGLFSFGKKLQATLETRFAGDPEAARTIESRLPALTAALKIGQQGEAVAGANFAPAAPPPGK